MIAAGYVDCHECMFDGSVSGHYKRVDDRAVFLQTAEIVLKTVCVQAVTSMSDLKSLAAVLV